MNIVIFSGGTGSIALQNGLRKLIPNTEITNIINLYDDGKSTGIARKICNSLGPSDARKNHFIQYLNEHKNELNENIVEFYESRFNNISKKFVYEKLNSWGLLDEFSVYVDFFFDLYSQKKLKIELNDFSIANIVYSSMFSVIGVQDTLKYFKNFLNLSCSEILINSEENLKLYAITKSGKLLGEEEIVKYFNSNDPIINIKFKNENNEYFDEYSELNEDIEDKLDNADIIIFSSGTQWSSLIPTYANKKIKQIIEKNSKKTMFIMNNEQDGDMSGISSNNLVHIIEKYISLKDTKFIVNKDANELLNSEIIGKKTYISKMGNINGKHDPDELAKTILMVYFDLFHILPKVQTICMDFDDTIFSRDENEKSISLKNCELIDNLSREKKIAIISGNGYENILNKLLLYFQNAKDIKFDIWADGGVVCYNEGKIKEVINDANLNTSEEFSILEREIGNINNKIGFNIQFRGNSYDYTSCISIKPFKNPRDKEKIVNLLNYIFKCCNWDVVANARGKTSIDIVSKKLSKIFAFEKYSNLDGDDSITLFIGDELEAGNDEDIFKKYPHNCIRVKNAYETNILLKLLVGNICH